MVSPDDQQPTSSNEQEPIQDVFLEVTRRKEMVERVYYRIDVLERTLAWKEMEDEEREKLEKELIELKSGVGKLESQIKGLNAENISNYQIGTLIIFLVLCIYGIIRVYEIEHQ
eukprot:TRINITY_DN5098_c0_g1_i1.p1 TRINITY_DN5098_c0_g1~~TRINITY_DN5098_c0_g1_i1.p1  ORF type:complete len:127 (+),score=19.25 TRINITY_DN5098_c0_g1_i1:42-383(+)